MGEKIEKQTNQSRDPVNFSKTGEEKQYRGKGYDDEEGDD